MYRIRNEPCVRTTVAASQNPEHLTFSRRMEKGEDDTIRIAEAPKSSESAVRQTTGLLNADIVEFPDGLLFIILYCIILYYIILYHIISYCTIQYDYYHHYYLHYHY